MVTVNTVIYIFMSQFALILMKMMLDKPKTVLVQDGIHRTNWKKSKFSVKDISGECAVFKHYFLKHNDNYHKSGCR